MELFLIILAAVAGVVAIIANFISKPWAAASAFIAMAAGYLGGFAHNTTFSLIFWLIAAVMVTVIIFALPAPVSLSTTGVAYISAGALAGMFIGLCIAHAAIIIGAVTGTVLGAIAYCYTPSGRSLGFPGRKAMNYLIAKAFPIMITTCIIGELIAAINLPL